MSKRISDTSTDPHTDALGDGYYDANGMCEKPDGTNRRCLSTGQCRRCQFVTTNSENTTVNRYEGCEGETSEEPICDAVANTTIIEFANINEDTINSQFENMIVCVFSWRIHWCNQF